MYQFKTLCIKHKKLRQTNSTFSFTLFPHTKLCLKLVMHRKLAPRISRALEYIVQLLLRGFFYSSSWPFSSGMPSCCGCWDDACNQVLAYETTSSYVTPSGAFEVLLNTWFEFVWNKIKILLCEWLKMIFQGDSKFQ